jgi:SAM-dependent methyltransferase
VNPGEYQKMYDLEEGYWWFVARRKLALDLLAEFADKSAPPYDLLDLGCGTGILLSEAEGVWHGTGADFSPLALEFCRSRGLTRLVCADGTALPLADASMDEIVALDVFEHIQDHAAAYAEAARVLRPGGTLVLSVPAFRWLWGPHDVALHHFRRYTKREIHDCLVAAGLQPVRVSYAIFLLFPFVILSRLLEKFKRGPAAASLPMFPDRINRFLMRIVNLESSPIARGVSFPWGSSVVAVAQKPKS